MSVTEVTLAIAVLVLLAANVVAWVWLWLRGDDVSRRVTRLEVRVDEAVTHRDLADIGARLATMNGQLMTAVQLMRSIQEHLLERE